MVNIRAYNCEQECEQISHIILTSLRGSVGRHMAAVVAVYVELVAACFADRLPDVVRVHTCRLPAECRMRTFMSRRTGAHAGVAAAVVHSAPAADVQRTHSRAYSDLECDQATSSSDDEVIIGASCSVAAASAALVHTATAVHPQGCDSDDEVIFAAPRSAHVPGVPLSFFSPCQTWLHRLSTAMQAKSTSHKHAIRFRQQRSSRQILTQCSDGTFAAQQCCKQCIAQHCKAPLSLCQGKLLSDHGPSFSRKAAPHRRAPWPLHPSERTRVMRTPAGTIRAPRARARRTARCGRLAHPQRQLCHRPHRVGSLLSVHAHAVTPAACMMASRTCSAVTCGALPAPTMCSRRPVGSCRPPLPRATEHRRLQRAGEFDLERRQRRQRTRHVLRCHVGATACGRLDSAVCSSPATSSSSVASATGCSTPLES